MRAVDIADAYNRLAAGPKGSWAVQLVLTGGPGGEESTMFRMVDGTLRAGPVDGEDSDLTLTMPYADWVLMIEGELPPTVAYMQGRLKPSGDMNAFIQLMILSHTPDFQRWRKEVEP